MLRFILVLIAILPQILFSQIKPASYVNPFIGTGGHGHTYPGATLPHGMVQLSPDTRLDGWDGCGGYHYSDSFIYGFTHTHLSGTGVSDYGDILLMPMNGKPSPVNSVYGSLFSHRKEKATPGFYNVTLLDNNIEVSCTASERVGFHKYQFSSAINNNIILDLKHRDQVIESSLKIEDSVTVSGMRRSKAWADNQYVFFVIRFSKPIINSGIWNNDSLQSSNIISNDSSRNLKAFFQFDLKGNKEILLKVAISPVSVDGAKRNLDAEIPGWNFTGVRSLAERKWNKELSRIEVSNENVDKTTIFYTALYHTAIVPNINMDVDGFYRGRDNKIHQAKDFNYYSVFSLWDTYRAAHPLYTIIDKKRTLDYIKTFLVQYEQGGRLPVWELASCETDCMIGYHSIPVIVDAYNKGITGFDTKLALEAMKKSANWQHLGLPSLISKGMIESNDESESVSKMLEYSYDDWCIADFARSTGNVTDYKYYSQRAQYYKNIFNMQSGFMQPRLNGDWLKPFDPREVNNHFTEANSWQYSFYMPQDIGGYLSLIGGPEKLERKLDQLFSAPTQTTGRDQSDITGLIGQYAHGNEPSHHIIYLYNYTAGLYKTQQLAHKVMKEMYLNAPDGLIGNEDCGQMSAWYVLSALGFYPVTPGTNNYMIGTPVFKKASINLENGRSFSISAQNVSDENIYITRLGINGSIWNVAQLKHEIIQAGGSMSFEMVNKPTVWGSHKSEEVHIPIIDKKTFVANPVIHGGGMPFKGSKLIEIGNNGSDGDIYFTTDGSEPDASKTRYTGPVTIDRSAILKAITIQKDAAKSFVTVAEYKKLEHDWHIKLNTPYEQHYTAGGAEGLIDGIRGTTNWRMGNWQGYQKQHLDVVIDLRVPDTVSKVLVSFLQDTKAWIVLPKEIDIQISTDGITYQQVYLGGSFLPIDDLKVQIKEVNAIFKPVYGRFIRIKAVQYGILPKWHEGAGGDTHIFIDEIQVGQD